MSPPSTAADPAPSDMPTPKRARISWWQKFKRGCGIGDVLVAGALPFMLLAMRDIIHPGLSLVGAVIALVMAPWFAYDLLRMVVRRRWVRSWLKELLED